MDVASPKLFRQVEKIRRRRTVHAQQITDPPKRLIPLSAHRNFKCFPVLNLTQKVLRLCKQQKNKTRKNGLNLL